MRPQQSPYLDSCKTQAEASGIYRNSGFGEKCFHIPYFISLWQCVSASETLSQKPHWDVLVVNDSLLNPQMPRVLPMGIAQFSLPTILLSAKYFLLLEEGEVQEEALRRLTRHELGHKHNLPLRSLQPKGLRGKLLNTIKRSTVADTLDIHCLNTCSMQQSITPTHMYRQALDEKRTGHYLCKDCQEDLRRVVRTYYH